MDQLPQRLIEIEHQYDRGSLPHYHLPCLCLTPRKPRHARSPVHHHCFFKVTSQAFKKPSFQDVCRSSRDLIKKNSKEVCLDNFDPQSAAYQQYRNAPRTLDFNKDRAVVVFGDKACKSSIIHMCMLTHEREIDIANIAYASNYSTLCCHWSDEYDREHRDLLPWGWPGLKTLQILHGIGLASFQNLSKRLSDYLNKSPPIYPGCRGLKKLYFIGTSDIFQQLKPSKIDGDTFFRKNYDITHAGDSVQSTKF